MLELKNSENWKSQGNAFMPKLTELSLNNCEI